MLVWDRQSGAEPVSFGIDQTDVTAVALLGADHGLLVVAGRDADDGPVAVQVSEAATRRQLGRSFGGLVRDVVQLSGDGSADVTAVVGVDAAGRADRWPIDRDPARESCTLVGRPLARSEWDAAASGELPPRDYAPHCAGD